MHVVPKHNLVVNVFYLFVTLCMYHYYIHLVVPCIILYTEYINMEYTPTDKID